MSSSEQPKETGSRMAGRSRGATESWTSPQARRSLENQGRIKGDRISIRRIHPLIIHQLILYSYSFFVEHGLEHYGYFWLVLYSLGIVSASQGFQRSARK